MVGETVKVTLMYCGEFSASLEVICIESICVPAVTESVQTVTLTVSGSRFSVEPALIQLTGEIARIVILPTPAFLTATFCVGGFGPPAKAVNVRASVEREMIGTSGDTGSLSEHPKAAIITVIVTKYSVDFHMS